ncbi:hypothetical protein NQ318_002598 [Aromia moschata]|uniref:Cytochrome P450 n=1 Tax=Aromia moschata TaxID=1265417 RepID=A0AAV8XYI5_9CUCU|nr:hypothetical protein NQ318_002598 [Aromia moschata]
MTAYLIFVLILVTIVLVLLIVARTGRKKYLKNLPGPKPLLLFGNTLDFIFSPKSKYFDTLRGYLKKYGDVVRVYDGALSVIIIISNYKLIEYILTSTKTIDKSKEYEYMHGWLGTGLLTSTGMKWKKHRRLITPSFHYSILTQFIDIFESVGNVFIEKLDKEVGKPSVDIYPMVSLCTLDIICEAAMGMSVNAQNDGNSEYVRSVKTVCEIFVDRSVSPVHTCLYALTPNYYREKRALKVLHAYTDGVIDKKIKLLSSNTENKSEDECGGKRGWPFSTPSYSATLRVRPFPGLNLGRKSTRLCLSTPFPRVTTLHLQRYHLPCTHSPHILMSRLQRVLDEQRHLFGDNPNPTITMTDLQNMKYLHLVIKETLRLYPSVPMYGRQLTEDLEWEGVLYPKGITMFLFSFDIHRNPKYFPEPEKFIPERFENYTGTEPFSYIPFSAGPRNCIGQKFAMLELKSTISKVIRHFKLLPAVPEHVLQLSPETITISSNGVRILLRRRER